MLEQIILKLARSGAALKLMWQNPSSRKKFFQALLWIMLFLGVSIFLSQKLRDVPFFTSENIALWLIENRYMAVLFYVLIVAVAVISPLPDGVLPLVGGYVFGPWFGTLLTIIGESLGATAGFWVARRFGRSFVKRRFPQAANLIDHYSKHLGWQTVFLFRLFPSLTFDVLSYAAGVSSISFRSYIFATMFGLIPLAFIGNFLGYSLEADSQTTAIVAVVGGAFIIIGISLFFHALFPQTEKQKKV